MKEENNFENDVYVLSELAKGELSKTDDIMKELKKNKKATEFIEVGELILEINIRFNKGEEIENE